MYKSISVLKFITIVIGTKLLAIALALGYYKYLDRPAKVLLLQTIVALVVESAGYFIIHVLRGYNLWLYNLYIITELLLLCYTASLLLHRKIEKLVISVIAIACSSIWASSLLQNGIFKFAHVALVVNCVVLTATYLYILISRALSRDMDLFRDPVSWVCLSTIIFFGCDLPFMTMINSLVQAYLEQTLKLKAINVNILLDMVRYLFLAVAFYSIGIQSKRRVAQIA